VTVPHTLRCDETRDLAPLFVTGSLEPAEAAAVREHLAGCGDAHPEMLELGEAATALLETVVPVEPPARLKAGLLAAAAADLEQGRHPASPAHASTAPVPRAPAASAAREDPLPAALTPVAGASGDGGGSVTGLDAARGRRGGSRLAWLVTVAAAVGAIALGAINLSLRQDLAAAQAYQDGVNQALDLAAKPGSVTALLVGEDDSVSGFGVVGSDGSVRLTMKGLAPTTGTQVYTAWAIEGDAAPVALGDFSVGPDGVVTAIAQSPTSAPGAVLALTLEPAPGATAPAGPVVAAGTTRDAAG